MSKPTKKIVMRKCAICGKKFTPKSANALYCSKKCYKVGKKAKNKASKAAKKAAIKKQCKCVEKIALAKKPTNKKVATKKSNTKIDTIISVKNGNPFKVFFLATMVRNRAMREIVKGGLLFKS